jgi:hypothetical protein
MRRSAGLAVTAFLIMGLAAVPVVNACTAFLASGDDGEVTGADVRIFRDDFTMAEQFIERMK